VISFWRAGNELGMNKRAMIVWALVQLSACQNGLGAPAGQGDGGRAGTDAGARSDGATTLVDSGGPIAMPPADGGPLVPVANCDSLPPASEGWHSLTDPSLHVGEAISVAVDPYSQALFASSGGGGGAMGTGILRSDDCGATFRRVNTGEHGDDISMGGHLSLQIEPRRDAPPILYTHNLYGPYGSVFRSMNGGVDFEVLNPDPMNIVGDAGEYPFVHGLVAQASDRTHLAVAFHDGCSRRVNGDACEGESCTCFSRSHDRGDTWEMFDGPRELSGWQEGASLNPIAENSYVYLSSAGTWLTNDVGRNWTQLSGFVAYCCYSGVTTQLPDGSILAPVGAEGGGLSITRPGAGFGVEWSVLAGTEGNLLQLLSTGDKVYASRFGFNGTTPFLWADTSDLTTWHEMVQPTITRTSNSMAYDPVHHVLYSANWSSGFFRAVVE
jgi:hypothetical protein